MFSNYIFSNSNFFINFKMILSDFGGYIFEIMREKQLSMRALRYELTAQYVQSLVLRRPLV